MFSLPQFKDKFMHESEHRPSGMSRGEFIYNYNASLFPLNFFKGMLTVFPQYLPVCWIWHRW